MTPFTVDHVVLGAGLAGIHVASALNERGAKVLVLDPFGIAAGASGTPIGLVNPATGRFATKSWNADACLPAVEKHLKVVQNETSIRFYKKTGVLRPALSAQIAERMRDNLTDVDWPENWVEWMDQKEVRDLHPGIEVVDGGVWVKTGMTVDIGTYLVQYKRLLQTRGVMFLDQNWTVTEDMNGLSWTLKTESSESIHTSSIIDCRGIYTGGSKEWWSALKLHAVKGQVAELVHDPSMNTAHAVSALGYMSSLCEGHTVIGSTYEHNFENEEPDSEGLEYLTGRLNRVLPNLIHNSKVKRQWAGVRASTPDRKPVLGSHPEIPGLYVFTGLGSKGLLYSAWGAECLSDYITDNKKIPDDINISRFLK